MKSDKFSFEQIIKYAATIEQRGVKLYTFAASKLKNEPARNILLHLAEQERKHEAYFRKLMEHVLISNYKSDQLDEQDVGYLSALVENDIFPADDNEFLSQIENMKDVIRVSKQAEKDSILFYVELARHTWDENATNTIKSIIEEEKRHLVQLQELDKLIEERDVYYWYVSQYVEKGIKKITVDDKPIEGNILPVFDDGREHHVIVEIGWNKT